MIVAGGSEGNVFFQCVVLCVKEIFHIPKSHTQSILGLYGMAWYSAKKEHQQHDCSDVL